MNSQKHLTYTVVLLNFKQKFKRVTVLWINMLWSNHQQTAKWKIVNLNSAAYEHFSIMKPIQMGEKLYEWLQQFQILLRLLKNNNARREIITSPHKLCMTDFNAFLFSPFPFLGSWREGWCGVGEKLSAWVPNAKVFFLHKGNNECHFRLIDVREWRFLMR